MKNTASLNLNDSPEIRKLMQVIEEAARSTEEGVKYYVEPGAGMLDRTMNKRHHLVFGRRGSGKSSLLRKAVAELSVQRKPCVYINLETFKSHTYPDVLLSVLIQTFDKFSSWLKNEVFFLFRIICP